MIVCEGVFSQSEAIKMGVVSSSASASASVSASAFGAEALERQFQNLRLEENGGEKLESDTAVSMDEKIGKPRFPLRPGEPDCLFYLRTGACNYGSSCRYNHPPGKIFQSEVIKTGLPGSSSSASASAAASASGDEALERQVQNLRLEESWGEKLESDPAVYLDEKIGKPRFPLRPGEPDCVFYLRTGACKYGSSCRYNHPPGKKTQSEAIKTGLPVSSASASASGAEAFEREVQNLRLEENGGEKLESDTAVYMDEKIGKPRFPLRPGEPDCVFYLRTGACKYGSSCRYNHPPGKKTQEQGKEYEGTEDTGEGPEILAQLVCKYYLTPGGCKYGKSCRYSHLDDKTCYEESVEYNFLGLPLRPGDRECPFYMQHGSCKFGINCRFHHPDPTAVDSTSGSQNGGSVHVQKSAVLWPMQSTLSEMPPQFLNAQPQPYASAMLSPHVVPSNVEWNSYQAPVNPLLPHELKNLQVPSPSIGASSTKEIPAVVDNSHLQPQNTAEEFPERPGEPECQYYMKTGNCKYRYACRFHHPKIRPFKSLPCVLSPLGLPLRPDQVICTYYSRFGICKYGPSCRFDHPMIHGSSSSSAASSSGKSISCTPNEDTKPAHGNTTHNVIQSTV